MCYITFHLTPTSRGLNQQADGRTDGRTDGQTDIQTAGIKMNDVTSSRGRN